MIDIIVRPYAAEDQADIFALILPIQQDEFGIAISAADQPDLSAIPSFYQSGSGGFWVAESEGQVFGTIALKDIGGNQGALRKMFVAKQARGGDAGVAKKLLEALIKHAKQVEIADIFLGTNEALLAAHRFYEKNGFVEILQKELPASFPVMSVDRKFYH